MPTWAFLNRCSDQACRTLVQQPAERLVKTPKLHFLDSGLLAALLGATTERITTNRSIFGPLLETFVMSEINVVGIEVKSAGAAGAGRQPTSSYHVSDRRCPNFRLHPSLMPRQPHSCTRRTPSFLRCDAVQRSITLTRQPNGPSKNEERALDGGWPLPITFGLSAWAHKRGTGS